MKGILRIGKKIVDTLLFCFFSLFPINKNLILFESEGDLSDNSYALYDYMNNNGYLVKYRAVWLVNNPKQCMDEVKCVFKWNEQRVHVKRAYYLATAKYIVYDHNYLLLKYYKRNSQIVIDLCHGTPFKAAKNTNKRIADETDILCAPSDFWIKYSADFYSGKYDRVLPIGYPRNDYLFVTQRDKVSFFSREGWDAYRGVVLWMPTYRKSNSIDLSEDYFNNVTGLPVIKQEADLLELNSLLKKLNLLLIFKIHHLQANTECFKMQYSNIRILRDEELRNNHIQLYQIVALTDFLITDYSSISNDYILLDRPMIFTLDDYEDYKESRGFSMDDPAQYLAGHHVYNKDELYEAIEDIANGNDSYKEKRHDILPILNKYQDGNSSKRLVEYLKL